MSAAGWTLLAAAGFLTVYGFAWALANAARIGDEGLGWMEDDQAVVDAEFAALTAPLEDLPFDQEAS